MPISFRQIIDSALSYQKNFVEISGYYHSGFEESSISSYSGFQNSQTKVWLEFTRELFDSLQRRMKLQTTEDVLTLLEGKKIKIGGILYGDEYGHLGQYAASIKYICYIEIF